jgi:hypothetical protein
MPVTVVDKTAIRMAEIFESSSCNSAFSNIPNPTEILPEILLESEDV